MSGGPIYGKIRRLPAVSMLHAFVPRALLPVLGCLAFRCAALDSPHVRNLHGHMAGQGPVLLRREADNSLEGPPPEADEGEKVLEDEPPEQAQGDAYADMSDVNFSRSENTDNASGASFELTEEFDCIRECPAVKAAGETGNPPICSDFKQCDVSGCDSAVKRVLWKVMLNDCDWDSLRRPGEAACVENTSTECASSSCSQKVLGPSICSIGWCLCKSGFCAVKGFCKMRPAAENACHLNTQTACPVSGCQSLVEVLGPSTCNDGACHCNEGLCYDSATGKCLKAGSFIAEPEEDDADAASGKSKRPRPRPNPLEGKSRGGPRGPKGPDGPVGKEGDEGALRIAGEDPSLFQRVVFVNVLIMAIAAYATYKHLIVSRMPIGKPDAKSESKPEAKEVGQAEQTGLVFEVIGAGMQAIDGKYVKVEAEPRHGIHWYRQVSASESQHELWRETDGRWAIGFFPSAPVEAPAVPGPAANAEDRKVFYFSPEGNTPEPPEGQWEVPAVGGGAAPAPALKIAAQPAITKSDASAESGAAASSADGGNGDGGNGVGSLATADTPVTQQEQQEKQQEQEQQKQQEQQEQQQQQQPPPA
eukprot:TRINITY_DN6352_c2_g2_i1.p1 TRINITY_DN6352_c2_g2~~TRINITY_DN6352_c2_g2_i1.p1  ORF type:complete len:590 (-),score=99.60 TRINITY_DN6352_c2_g2_i1:370-2139(-)